MRKLPDYGDDGGAVDGDGDGDEKGGTTGTGTESDIDQHVGRMEMESEEGEQGHFSFGDTGGVQSVTDVKTTIFFKHKFTF